MWLPVRDDKLYNRGRVGSSNWRNTRLPVFAFCNRKERGRLHMQRSKKYFPFCLGALITLQITRFVLGLRRR